MYYVYILKSLKDGRFYIGSTSNTETRLAFHNAGLQRSTKNRIPFVLKYVEEFDTPTKSANYGGFLLLAKLDSVSYQ